MTPEVSPLAQSTTASDTSSLQAAIGQTQQLCHVVCE